MSTTATGRARSLLRRYDNLSAHPSPRAAARMAALLANAVHELLWVTGDLTDSIHDVPERRALPILDPNRVDPYYVGYHTHACSRCETSLECDRRDDICNIVNGRTLAICNSCHVVVPRGGRYRELQRSR